MSELLDTMDLCIIFFQKNKSFDHFWVKNMKTNLFTCKTNKFDVLKSISTTNIGEKFSDNASESLHSIDSKIFKNFKIRLKSINYRLAFKRKVLGKQESYFNKTRKVKGENLPHFKEKIKCKNQVHPTQIQEGFQTILYKTITQELIGNKKNKKHILKTLKKFLLTAKTEKFSLYKLIRNLDISSIKWIHSIKSQQEKYILLAKFIKWLFQYFILIIYHLFQIVYIKEERVLIFVQDWNKQKKTYLKKLNDSMILQPINRLTAEKSEITAKLFIFPKKLNGLRSVIKISYVSNKMEEEIKKISCILNYLCGRSMKNSIDNFSNKFIQFIENLNSDNKTYLISADINDAYGSIIQGKLYEILQYQLENLPSTLWLQPYKFNRIKKFRISNFSNTAHVNHSNKAIKISKDDIQMLLYNIIFKTQVLIHNKVYILTKGVPQGFMLSAAFCNIYYTQMQLKHFADFKNSGFIYTYVDDIIYMTKKLSDANKYSQKISNDIPEFNCRFNQEKLRNNFNLNDKQYIEFLGIKIESNLLEVEPQYSSMRYSTIFTHVSSKNLEKKLRNFAFLKLNKVVLSKKVNDKKRIFSNIYMITLHLAKRICVYMNYLNYTENYFNNLNDFEQKKIFKIIKKVHFRIIKRVENLTDWNLDKNEKVYYNQHLEYIAWKSFYEVLSKKNDILAFTTKKIKTLMRKQRMITKIF